MKFDNKIFILLTTITIFFSCSIDKRLYRNGFYIDNSIIFENKSQTIDYPVDNSHQGDDSSFQPEEPDNLIASNTTTNNIISIKKAIYQDSSLQTLKIKSNKVNDKFYKVKINRQTMTRTNLPLTRTAKKNYYDSDDFWEGVKDFLGWLLGLIIFLAIIFLTGFGLHILFPSLSLLLAVLLAIPLLFLIIFIPYAIKGGH